MHCRAVCPRRTAFGSSSHLVAHAPRRIMLYARKAVSVRAAAATSELPQGLKSLVESFQAVPDPMARYKQLLFFATKLEKLPAEDHTNENKVWVVPELREDGRIYWRADSDSQLTKGLAALLVQGLSGCTPAEIVAISPDFISLLGLQQALTPSRNNGFLNMFKLMQQKSVELLKQQLTAASADGGAVASSSNSASSAAPSSGNGAAAVAAASSSAAPAASEGSSASSTPTEDSMRRKLTDQLSPLRLTIHNESHRHAGHSGHVGSASATGETHFNVEVVSKEFEGLSTLKRHRLVFTILEEELKYPVHALSVVTKTPAEAGLE